MKSRVNNKKQQQLKAKLQGVKTISELKHVYGSVEEQNNTLREDVLALRYKVDLLVQKQKTQNSYVSREDELKNSELHMFQEDLKQQYKIMQELKKRKEQSNSQKGSEEINEQLSSVVNKLKTTEGQLGLTKAEVNDLRKQAERLERTVAESGYEEKRN